MNRHWRDADRETPFFDDVSSPLRLLRRRAGYRIVVVERDVGISSSLLRVMREAGHDATALAESVPLYQLLRDRAAARSIDLVVTDTAGTRLGGMDLLAMTDPRGRPPIILTTTRASPPLLRAAFELGAAAVLPKPFEPERLLAAIDDIVARRDGRMLDGF